MFLFINPLQSDITLSLIENDTLIKKISIPYGDDFLSFPKTVSNLIESESIEEIWCISGPGPFTRMRIVTLALNTFRVSKNIILKGCHFFDLIDIGIPILEINNTECLIQNITGNSILINKNDIPQGSYIGYISKNDFTDTKVFIEYKEDYGKISKLFGEIEEQKGLSPIYYKNPHITCSKKNTSHS